MLAIRLQRTGRSGHAQFRLIAQDSRFSPSSGRVVAYLGNYDPHSKQASIDKDKTADFLKNGAQPSARAAKLLKAEGVKLPSWVAKPVKQEAKIRNPEKLRKNRPADAKAAADKPAGTEAPKTETATSEAPTEEAASESPEAPAGEEASPAEETPADEPAAEEPKAEEAAAETEKPAEPEAPAEAPAAETEQK